MQVSAISSRNFQQARFRPASSECFPRFFSHISSHQPKKLLCRMPEKRQPHRTIFRPDLECHSKIRKKGIRISHRQIERDPNPLRIEKRLESPNKARSIPANIFWTLPRFPMSHRIDRFDSVWLCCRTRETVAVPDEFPRPDQNPSDHSEAIVN
jgi:hypothetical protein